MKSPIVAVLLLTPALAFGQKFQDVTPKGGPLSLSAAIDPTDHQPYITAHNNSGKGVLALSAVFESTDVKGETMPGVTRQDYAFEKGVMGPKEERGIAPLMRPEETVKIDHAEGAVLFVQFEDGSIWGDSEAGKQILSTRPQRLEFLKHLVETYYTGGEAAFNTVLNQPQFSSPESSVAGCLKADAEYEKITTVELAKKRLADALEWRAVGIF